MASSKTVLVVASLSGWILFLIPLAMLYSKETTEVQVPLMYQASYEEDSSGAYRNPIPSDEKLLKMTEAELEFFVHTYVSSPQATCSLVVRMGSVGNGGWETCLDPRYAPDPDNCLVYSFGINYEWSFDDAMERYGCEVHSFDPSMLESEDHLRGQRVHFHLEGIGGENVLVNQAEDLGTWQLYTLGTIRSRLGHAIGKRRVDVVKMDVEKEEFNALPQALAEGILRDTPQLLFEVHTLNQRESYLKVLPLLRDLYDRGMRIFVTTRNLGCKFKSNHFKNTYRTHCLEIHMVNTTLARW